ncbi:MAG: LysR family transcriptional regulator [Oscillospiraceae bacterium]|nr:LysR family transcriptional regulator [Oscillospiraceae bacterium]
MRNIDVRNISLGQIQYFLKVAECKSFTKAAAYFYLTQPTISKSIAAMESMLGILLFVREKQSIRLTPAGRHLYEKWSGVAVLVEDAVEEAYAIQKGYMKKLSIGGMDSHRPEIFMLPSVEAFQKKYQNVSIRVDTGTAEDVREMLTDGELDIILTVLYDSVYLNENQYCCTTLYEVPLEACMLKTNPLAGKEMLNITDLSKSDFIAISPLQLPSYTEMLRALCEPHGFLPNFSCYTSNANSLTLNLTSSNDIFICDRFYRDYGNDHLCFRPIAGTKSGIVMCWKKDNLKKELSNFAEITKQHAERALSR